MKNLFRFLIISVMLLYSSTAISNQWNIDHDHSEIRFKVKHIYSTISGQFAAFQGDIFFNPANLDKAKFDFTVKVKTINTNNGKRDNHLRSKDFFNVDKFPVMKFKSLNIIRIKDNLYALEGMMTIKDVTKKMNLKFQYFEPQQHPFDNKKLVVGFKTSFIIPRLDFHVGNGKFLKMGVVGENVNVEMSMEALRKK